MPLFSMPRRRSDTDGIWVRLTRLLLVLLTASLAWQPPAQAGDPWSELDDDPGHWADAPLQGGSQGNRAKLDQHGRDNRADITLDGHSLNALIRQEGLGNQATFLLLGDGHQGTLHQSGSGNRATVNLVGSDNRASVDQSGHDLTTGLFQVGVENAARVDQHGSGNRADVIQNGTYNRVLIDQSGRENSADVMQNGNANQASIEQLGSDNRFELVQTGDNLAAPRITQLGGAVARITQTDIGSNLDVNGIDMQGFGIVVTTTRP